jgi:mRNA-degrading endonuclease RelE of RelBE toxin-antitoxin system
MRAVLTEPFVDNLIKAPPEIQKLFGKQLANLLRDLRHRSLDAKKHPESGNPDLWQARVNGGWRFYFTIEGNTYVFRALQSHPK